MSLRLIVQENVVYEGEPIPVPRVGDGFQFEGQTVPVEAVTWEYAGRDVSVTLVLGPREYTY
jgi:hypothetical protein